MTTALESILVPATLVVAINRNGTLASIADASETGARLLASDRSDLRDLPLSNIIDPTDLPRVMSRLAEGTPALRIRFVTRSGTRLDCNVLQQQLQLGDQRIILWTLRDQRDADSEGRLKEAFATLAHRLSSVRTAREAATAVMEIADELFGWDACHLNLYPEGRDRALSIINMDTVNGVRREFPSASPETPISPMSRRVLREGAQLILINPNDLEPHRSHGLVSFGAQEKMSASLMFVPIRKGKKNVGVLSIQSYQTNKYRRDDLDGLQVLADHCSGTFERLLAEEKLHRQIFLTNTYAELGKQLAIASTPIEAAKVLLDAASVLFGWHASYVVVYDEEEDMVTYAVAYDEIDGKRTTVDVSGRHEKPQAFFREVLTKGAKLILRSGNEELSSLPTFGDESRRSRSLLLAPMRIGSRRVGLISIQSYKPEAYTFEDLHGLQALADHGAGALARSFAEQNFRASEARLRLVTSQIPTILWSVDRQLNIVMLLGEALTQLDVVAERWIGAPLHQFLEVFHSAEGGIAQHDLALRGHTGVFEMTIGDRTFHSHVEALLDENGHIIGAVNISHDVTARRLAEDDLRKFKLAIEQSPTSVIISNAANMVEYVNSAHEQQTGWRREEILSKPRPFEAIGINPGDYLADLRARVGAGLPYNGVVTAQRRDGTYYFEGKTITPLRDTHGTITHYVETGKDITEKLEQELSRQRSHEELEKRVKERTEELTRSNAQLLREIKERRYAEEELERSLSLLRATLESTTDGIMVVDLQGHLVSFNQKWLQMWEISFSLAEDLEAPDLHRILCAQLREPEVMAPFHGRRPQPETFQILELTDGRVYECYSKASMIGGKSVGRVWSFRDITRRRRDEEALARSEQIYREAIENASGVPYRWDYKTKRYDFMGTGFKDLLGLEGPEVSKEMIELMVQEYQILDADGGQDIRDYRLAVRDGRISKYRVDLKLLTADGSEKWVTDCSVPVRDPKTGAIVGTLGILQDITERKKAEDQARLQQDRLVQSEKLVALGTLVSGVAHEINNPNNFIMLNAPILMDAWQSLEPVVEEYFDDNGDFICGGLNYSEMREEIPKLLHGVLAGAQRIRSIVQELRDFSRPNPNSHREAVDVNAVVKSALVLLQNVIVSNTTRFQLDCSDGLPLIMGNFQRLEQVVINLIQNACQSLPRKDCAVRVRTMYEDDGFVVIEVADEGKGIEAAHLKQITDPFFTTKRDTGGTGLGLSISSNIVHNHGGILEFQSQVGVGTTARVKFLCGQPSGDTPLAIRKP
jgi:PAS domain S-box-containing protein